MKYKLLVFDFDGTLADSFPFFLGALGTLADTYGFKRIDHDHVEMLRGHDVRQMIKHVGLPLWKMLQLGTHFKALMAQRRNEINLFDGISGVLRRLSDEGVCLAIVTSNSIENVKAILGPENTSFITHYECEASLFCKRSKLRRLLTRSGIPRHEVLCIGDEIRDVEAAHAEKLAFGAVGWGYTRLEALRAHSPELEFATVGELLEQLVA